MPSDPLPTAKMPDRSVRLPTSSHRKRPLQSALSQGTGSLASSCSGRTVSVYSVSSSSPNLLRSCILLSFLRYILMEMYVPPSVSICIISRLWIVRSVPAHSRTRKSRASLLQKALYGSGTLFCRPLNTESGIFLMTIPAADTGTGKERFMVFVLILIFILPFCSFASLFVHVYPHVCAARCFHRHKITCHLFIQAGCYGLHQFF